jgi:hypothetical protein
VLVYHAISIWVPSLGGLLAWLSARRGSTRKRPNVRPAGLRALALAEATESEG